MTTIDDKLTAVYVALSSDATLQDANHLGGAGRVHKGARTTGSSVSALTINTRGADIEGEQPFMDEDFVRIMVYLPLASDRTPEMQRFGNIERRIRELLDGQTLTLGGARFTLTRDPSWASVGVDPSAPGEFAWSITYYMRSK